MSDDIKYLDYSIMTLNLSTRASNILMHNGIYTIGDLLIIKYNDLKIKPKMGEKSFYEIVNAIHNLGLVLFDEDKTNVSDELIIAINNYKENKELIAKNNENEQKENIIKYNNLINKYDLYNLSILNLHLPAEIYNTLKNNNFLTLGSILKYESIHFLHVFKDSASYGAFRYIIKSHGFVFNEEIHTINENNIKLLENFIDTLIITNNNDDVKKDIVDYLKQIQECRELLSVTYSKLQELNENVIKYIEENNDRDGGIKYGK